MAMIKAVKQQTPDTTSYMKARRRGFEGTISTDILGRYLFITDVQDGVVFISGNQIFGGTGVYSKAPYYKVFKLSRLGLNGGKFFAIYRDGKRQSLRYAGYSKKHPSYVIHDKQEFRVKYVKGKGWLYQNPSSSEWEPLPFPPDELCLFREDVKNYTGDRPSKHEVEQTSSDFYAAEKEESDEPMIISHSKPRDERKLSESQPQPQPQPQPQKPRQTKAEVAPASTKPMDVGRPDYKLVKKICSADGVVKGYVCMDRQKAYHRYSVKKVLELAQSNKIYKVKAVDRGSGLFLQGYDGFVLNSLPVDTN